jgi:hypothetical protein
MFVGHIGAGLVLKRVEPRLNLGLLVFAALFADLLLWLQVLVGMEFVLPPLESGPARYFSFVFPYSHGLVASIAWSVLAAVAVWWLAPPGMSRRVGLAVVVALAVSSHFVLDFLVHVPDLPVLSEGSPKLGLGLWAHMPIALAVELAFACAALVVYLRGSRLTRGRRWLAVGIVALTGVLTAAGPYIRGAPPSSNTLAASSLVTLLIVVLLAFALEGRVSVTTARPSVG